MNYLLFIKEGFVRKFPLTGKTVFIGRDQTNDLVIDNPTVSRRHARLDVFNDYLVINDLDSSNGVFVQGRATEKARLNLNEAFTICGYDFLLQRGDPQQFEVSNELWVKKSREKPPLCQADREETQSSLNLHKLIIDRMRQLTSENKSLERCFKELSSLLRPLYPKKALILLQRGRVIEHLIQPESGQKSDHKSFSAEIINDIRLGQKKIKLHDTEYDVQVVADREQPDYRLICMIPAGGPSTRLPVGFLPELFSILVRDCLGRKPEINLDPEIMHQGKDYVLIGRNPEMKRIVDICRRIADKDKFVLIMGESGTGKELIARFIHDLSGRRNYIAINCAAIPASLLESELFGYEPGAFTDARKRKIGKIEEASGGTLVLDEIGDMPLETQAKLLRAIQEKAITRLGGNETIAVDLRIISLTNQNLMNLMKEGRFRQDLFFRLRVHELIIPPLRERQEDISDLINYFVNSYSSVNRITPAGFSREAHLYLQKYSWPGNVRELENTISRLMDIVDNGEIIGSHLLCPMLLDSVDCGLKSGKNSRSRPDRSAEEERREVQETLRKTNGNKSQAARKLGITYQGLLKKLRRLDLAGSIRESRNKTKQRL